MRVLALHLPQFHEVPENNEWWGQGFTEWTNVKSAKPLYTGHCKPAHPLGDNYYDLSEPDSLIWQARTARKYGVDGFVFFHYWYSGKLLLEKPVDLWRSTVDADLDYAYAGRIILGHVRGMVRIIRFCKLRPTVEKTIGRNIFSIFFRSSETHITFAKKESLCFSYTTRVIFLKSTRWLGTGKNDL